MILHGVVHKEFFAERNSGEPLGEPVRLFQEGGPSPPKRPSVKPRLATLQEARREKSDNTSDNVVCMLLLQFLG
jgi:hypothetical protein